MASLEQGKILSFDETLSRLEAEQRVDPAVTRTANYLFSASLLDEERDLIYEARKRLVHENPRELYIQYLKNTLDKFIHADPGEKYKYVKRIDDVGIMGLGIWQEDLGISSAGQKALKITSEPKWEIIQEHIENTVFGNYFVEKIDVPNDFVLWGNDFPLRLSACDASQHRFKLRVPFNKTWATPVIVNNSGGTIKEKTNGEESKWIHIAVPKDTRDYEDWVIIGPDDYANMDEGDYEWAAKSSMDVGQYFIEETFIFKHGGLTQKPDVHFRDGRIFPQDKLMNCNIINRHGQLTREAIYRMTSTFKTSEELKILFCGVAKQVNLKVFSCIVDWYITEVMQKPNWNPTGHVMNDSEMARFFLSNNDFQAKTFHDIYKTCSILRRFETTSNLNRRTRNQIKSDLDSLDEIFQSRYITAKDIALEALNMGVVMFFAGHAKTNEQYIPRYEFAVNLGELKPSVINDQVQRVLSTLRLASFDIDEDHLWGLDEPISTLVPTPILVAHDISKKMGEELSSNFAQRTIAEFINQLKNKNN